MSICEACKLHFLKFLNGNSTGPTGFAPNIGKKLNCVLRVSICWRCQMMCFGVCTSMVPYQESQQRWDEFAYQKSEKKHRVALQRFKRFWILRNLSHAKDAREKKPFFRSPSL